MDLSFKRLQNFFPAAIPFWVKLSCLMGALVICFSTTCLLIFSRHQKLNDLSLQISALAARAEGLQKQKQLHELMKKQVAKGEQGYIKKKVESIPLLQGEHIRVAALAKQFPDNAPLKERLQFLQSDQNRIVFESTKDETILEHRLIHRVQMDVRDLRNFLEAVEGDRYDATEHKPFLVMKKFDLIKCYEKGDEKVYSIHAELIQK